MKATTELPAALLPWFAYWLVHTVWSVKKRSMPAVEIRKSGRRPTRSQNRPPRTARINDHMLRKALIKSCSTVLVTSLITYQQRHEATDCGRATHFQWYQTPGSGLRQHMGTNDTEYTSSLHNITHNMSFSTNGTTCQSLDVKGIIEVRTPSRCHSTARRMQSQWLFSAVGDFQES